MPKHTYHFNFIEYARLLRSVAALSKLYSDSDTPLLHYRFIEKLYVHTSNAKDLSKLDKSFDALVNDSVGVGIKTFTANSDSTNEKIAEFTKDAKNGEFKNLTHLQIAKKSSELRNIRVNSDASEYGIDLDRSIYHCLVRQSGMAFIHEEPYPLIKIANIEPTDKFGNVIRKFPRKGTGHTYFTDGDSKYVFNVSKNVLFKKFELTSHTNSRNIRLNIIDNIFDSIHQVLNMDFIEFSRSSQLNENEYVILPLYSTRDKRNKVVPQKSGLNQWNASGRKREFGEAYIPIPQEIHRLFPGFFPDRGIKFGLKLPAGEVISVKICQSDDKAIMSDPNKELGLWLFKMIDIEDKVTIERASKITLYCYDDLRKIGKDSVKITKVSGENYDYEIQSMPLDSYEEFITSVEINSAV